MTGIDITETAVEEDAGTPRQQPVPVLMVAHAPPEAVALDRCRLCDGATVGRGAENLLTIEDRKMSGRHLRISLELRRAYVEDLGSTNGTYLDGERVVGIRALDDNAVIRAGQSVLVYREDGAACLVPPPIERHGMVGRFHIASILSAVEEAALSREHLLITGPSGSGKELAARAIAAVMSRGRSRIPFVAHNAACFTSEDEATSTLFGIASRAFTSVGPRPGLIEQAEGGVLFLDEIHNYTTRVQRSLLRVIEDNRYSRIGETATRVADVRFVMASNEPCLTRTIAPDLLGRLRRSLTLPPLTERRADIPSIFNAVLKRTLAGYGITDKAVRSHLKGRHYEQMCLDAFEAFNIRGIRHLADIIATKIAAGTSAAEAIEQVFFEQLRAPSPSPSTDGGETGPFSPAALTERLHSRTPTARGSRSVYESNKRVIIELFEDRDGNIAATERALKKRGIRCSRRWLAHFLGKWGVR